MDHTVLSAYNTDATRKSLTPGPTVHFSNILDFCVLEFWLVTLTNELDLNRIEMTVVKMKRDIKHLGKGNSIRKLLSGHTYIQTHTHNRPTTLHGH